MMVYRAHFEYAPAEILEAENLYHNRKRFYDENSADNGQQKLAFREYRNQAERAAESQRTDVAHENFGRRSVIPVKTQAGADERGAINREFARSPYERKPDML